MNTLFETGQDGGTATTHDERGDMSRYTLHQGDSREVLKGMADASVDSIVCDPPYELGFMGKSWDSTGIANDVTLWRQALRALKPGGHLLAFGGTRTYHRMVCAIEDAGFEVRDQLAWVYGSGFPKSHNGEWGGTALKPAWEPICMARKPLIGTVAENWAAHGTGALNIDDCRVGLERPASHGGPEKFKRWKELDGTPRAGSNNNDERTDVGRWPANLIHDGSDQVVALFPYTASGTGAVKRSSSADQSGNTGAAFGAESHPAGTPMICHGDEGSAARFFYCAKAGVEDREEGLLHLARRVLAYSNQAQAEVKRGNTEHTGDSGMNTVKMRGNHHPTVKPTDLMAYLCRLVTPKGGTVLDPFMGSGSTGKAAMREGFNFIGIELSAEYIEIARARIEFALRQGHQPSLLEAA